MPPSMDEKIEPVLAVIGHPVAGNPTQFALESAFEQANVDCRVLSFDLSPQQLPVAVDGMHAMSFRGVWIDSSCRGQISEDSNTASSLGITVVDPSLPAEALRTTPESKPGQPPPSHWQAISVREQTWTQLIRDQLELGGFSVQQVLVISSDTAARKELSQRLVAENQLAAKTSMQTGPSEKAIAAKETDPDCPPAHDSTAETTPERVVMVSSPEEITTTSLANVWLAVDGPASKIIDAFRSSTTPPGTVLVDLNENWDANDISEWERCKMDAGSNCITRWDIHAACLAKVVPLWLGTEVRVDVLREAMEEYLSV
ncbi:shikimate dehydrogenase [Rhodopirellula sp. P2]|uniref:shikimate dehydrogenase n=1 Tax=Rhodopirellula sp. P2 TaxID=2127060 RepID=UPI0023677C15|nr:shikimate dehydrogenase [Rhodopirellula sp. P2]WDQ17502.1 shikimate dehydrogenase [Rhodopirellula sp. P2]